MNFSRGLAFVQFIVVALGVFALHLMVKLGAADEHSETVATWTVSLARYGLWLFAVPILWTVLAIVLHGKLSERSVNFAGIFITALLILTLAVPVIACLS